jgi:(R,R)-butanediol dehydrogenase/meso-butanediol dehydrogenase/diacetyl reductase
MGAGNIIVTARTTRRADLARAVGATEFLENDDKLSKEFARICGGPPDAVFECVGNPGMIERCVRLAPPRSTVVVLGVCMQRDSFRPMPAVMKELKLQFALAYSTRDFQTAAGMMQRRQVNLEGMVTDTVGFDAFPDAFEALRQRSTQCKVMLAPQ